MIYDYTNMKDSPIMSKKLKNFDIYLYYVDAVDIVVQICRNHV